MVECLPLDLMTFLEVHLLIHLLVLVLAIKWLLSEERVHLLL